MHREILLDRVDPHRGLLPLNRNIPCVDLINLFEVRHRLFIIYYPNDYWVSRWFGSSNTEFVSSEILV